MSKCSSRIGFVQLQGRRGTTHTATFWRSKVAGCLGTWLVLTSMIILRCLTSSLVFAIQKCDPAPFYLFDEVRQCPDGC